MLFIVRGRTAPTVYVRFTPIGIPRSNRIRHMRRSRDSWVFVLTLMTAAAVLISIAGAETLLAMACIAWIAHRPRTVIWPSYLVPLGAFMLTTTLALVMSPEPDIGMAAVRKFVLLTIAVLAANVVTTVSRARIAIRVLL